jgi:hypothetical protein
MWVTSSNGQILTITSVVDVVTVAPAPYVPSSSSTVVTPTASSTPFMQNKALAGSVFGIGGCILLVILISLGTMALRRSRKNKLEEDALVDAGPSIVWPGVGGVEEKLPGEERLSTVDKTPRPGSVAVSSAHYGFEGTNAGYSPSLVTPPYNGTPGPSFNDEHGYGAAASQYPTLVAGGSDGHPQALIAAPQQWTSPHHAPGFTEYSDHAPPGLYSPHVSPVPLGGHSSLLNAAGLPDQEHTGTDEPEAHAISARRSYSRELDMRLPEMPMSPALPDMFGEESFENHKA